MRKIKNILLMTIAILIAFPFINGCKKGEDDPFLSLKSRDAKITAKWKLTSIIGDFFSSYNGTNYSIMMSGSGTGTYEMTIDKDGKVTYNESCIPSGGSAEITSGTGNWIWKDTDKKKTYICFLDGGGTVLFSSGEYYVNELKSKELVLKPTPYSTVKYIFEKQ